MKDKDSFIIKTHLFTNKQKFIKKLTTVSCTVDYHEYSPTYWEKLTLTLTIYFIIFVKKFFLRNKNTANLTAVLNRTFYQIVIKKQL